MAGEIFVMIVPSVILKLMSFVINWGILEFPPTAELARPGISNHRSVGVIMYFLVMVVIIILWSGTMLTVLVATICLFLSVTTLPVLSAVIPIITMLLLLAVSMSAEMMI